MCVTTVDRLRHPQCLEVCILPLPFKRKNIPKIASPSPTDWRTTKATPILLIWMGAQPLTGSKQVLEHHFSSWFSKTSLLKNIKSSFKATGRERTLESTKPRLTTVQFSSCFQTTIPHGYGSSDLPFLQKKQQQKASIGCITEVP